MLRKVEYKSSSMSFVCLWRKDDRNRLIKIVFGFILLVPLCFDFLCSSSINGGFPVASNDFKIDAKPIILLPIAVSFVFLENETPLSTDYKINEVRNALDSLIKAIFVVKRIDLNSIDRFHLSKELTSKMTWLNGFNLHRSALPSDLKHEISILGAALGYPAILAISLKVKVGSSSTWNPVNGAITSANSYSVLKAVLINSQNSEILWKNQLLFRKVPDAKSPEIHTSCKTIFQSIIRKEI